MFSKSMPERSAPQFGIGRARKYSSALRRDFRIQSGSFLWAEISATPSGLSPRWDLKT
jgi:hypothetical protein